ncbi:MAG: hypothetical protein ACR2NR_11735 [Solirubrobacteraceae bacterium]
MLDENDDPNLKPDEDELTSDDRPSQRDFKGSHDVAMPFSPHQADDSPLGDSDQLSTA